MFDMPIIDADLCNGCGLCLTVCECGALVITDSIVTIQETDDCGYCTECEAVCPTGAIQCPYEIVIEDGFEQTWNRDSDRLSARARSSPSTQTKRTSPEISLPPTTHQGHQDPHDLRKHFIGNGSYRKNPGEYGV